SYQVVQQLAPSVSEEEYRQSFIAPAKCHDLADFLTRAVKGIELMQTREQLRLVTLDLFRQLQHDNVIYAEIRYAPLEHLAKGLRPEEVVQTINEAVLEGSALTGISAGVILCTLRHYSGAQSMETVQLVHRFRGTPVVGFDIAADEAGFPIDNHVAAFEFARTNDIPCTAHAGEACGAESVWETLRHFHPRRIGHGVRSIEDPLLIEYLKKNGLHLEICPTSNIQTNIYATLTEHPVNRIYQAGVSLSINTDARTITNVSLCSEYQVLEQCHGWTSDDFLHCNLEAVENAFAPAELKAVLREKLKAAYL
ncbi:MAG TPA: adenosine deaminase, partial [Saprospiraceae bacterium]|nr:adenosine deaminase [Saprospiraceae bacterium]